MTIVGLGKRLEELNLASLSDQAKDIYYSYLSMRFCSLWTFIGAAINRPLGTSWVMVYDAIRLEIAEDPMSCLLSRFPFSDFDNIVEYP